MKPTHEELEQQLSESRREFWAAGATINNLELKLAKMAEQLANAESKCASLAAELRAKQPHHNVNSDMPQCSEPVTDNTNQQFESLSRATNERENCTARHHKGHCYSEAWRYDGSNSADDMGKNTKGNNFDRDTLLC